MSSDPPARPAQDRIRPRRMDFQFDPAEIPRWWFHDNPLITHFANGLHLVFPEGERFFIRSVNHYLGRLDDPELEARARAFFSQESEHGREHAASFEMLEAHGYRIRPFLDFYEKRAMPWMERMMPAPLRLSVTAALEHLTATLGEHAITDSALDGAHPTMRALLRWHAAEEIEHKSVAFDVLKRVAPSYLLRIAGMVLGYCGLLLFWGRGMAMLMRQERLPFRERRRYFRAIPPELRGTTRRRLRRAVVTYLRPSFHPDQRDNLDIARTYLDSVGRLTG